MKKWIISMMLFMLLGIGLILNSEVKAVEAEATSAPEEKTITEIEVTDTALEIPYGSKFSGSDITLLVHYSDGTTEIVHPDTPITVDTSVLGKQTISVQYKGEETSYTITVVPRQVTGVRMQGGTSDSMKVGWNALEEAKEYEIYVSTKKDGEFTLLTSTEKTEYAFEDLEIGEIIYVKVRAVSEDVAGEYSDITPVAPKPSRVTKVWATAAVKTKITLAWDEVEGATGYAIYYRLSTKSAYTYAGSTTALSYKVTGLSTGKDYYFKVYAYGADLSNLGDPSDEVLYGTAPAIPVISQLKGGDKRVKVYWKKAAGAQLFRIYVSTKASSGFKLAGTVSTLDALIFAKDGLVQNKKYYVKVVSVRTVSGMELTSTSDVKSAKTKKANKTSTAAKYYTTKKKFKKSTAYKKYKAFRKKVSYTKSFILPGMKNTNVGGFDAKRMVPQSIAFAGDYLLISAYDYSKAQESVLYIMNKKTRKYISTIVLPHKGHVGGMAYDGNNLWLAYGKKMQCIKYSVIQSAVQGKKQFTEIYRFAAECPALDTVSYITYYNGKIWAGAYNEKVQKYMYGYTISNKKGTPALQKTHQILMPNRTQGVAITSAGKMIVSRSCQTKEGKSGFISQLVTYKPTWNFASATIKKNKMKKVVKMPPMNEGIVISGSYLYVVYESPAFSDCKAPVDRVTAFKLSKVS
ncbi:MAG: bacterial Ig-like domain-containing protein [Lachnospiraceae bacterium]|nr:bacterial Ig-like domain-containing protein [Lachnospiraceae bacterium]